MTLVREPEAVMLWTTVATNDDARQLARAVVEGRAAACANVVDRLQSYYWWNGALQQDEEFLVIFKTTADRLDDLRREILARHKYEVPELVVVKIDAVGEHYLQWLRDQTVR